MTIIIIILYVHLLNGGWFSTIKGNKYMANLKKKKVVNSVPVYFHFIVFF